MHSDDQQHICQTLSMRAQGCRDPLQSDSKAEMRTGSWTKGPSEAHYLADKTQQQVLLSKDDNICFNLPKIAESIAISLSASSFF